MPHADLAQLMCLATIASGLLIVFFNHKERIRGLERDVARLAWSVRDLQKTIADIAPEIESKPFHSMTPEEQRSFMAFATKHITDDSESTARVARKPFKPVIVPSGPPCEPPISGKPYR